MGIRIYEPHKSVSTTYEPRKPRSELGQQEFLHLLVTELQYQDPLSPMDHKETIAQLAQFTALEAMNNVRSELQQLKAANLVGKQVIVKLDDESLTQGIVTAVSFEDNEPKLCVNNTYYQLEQVVGAAPAQDELLKAMKELQQAVETLGVNQEAAADQQSQQTETLQLIAEYLESITSKLDEQNTSS